MNINRSSCPTYKYIDILKVIVVDMTQTTTKRLPDIQTTEIRS